MAGRANSILAPDHATDLVIEGDAQTRSSMDRMVISRLCSVREIRRLKGDDLTFHVAMPPERLRGAADQPGLFRGLHRPTLIEFLQQAGEAATRTRSSAISALDSPAPHRAGGSESVPKRHPRRLRKSPSGGFRPKTARRNYEPSQDAVGTDSKRQYPAISSAAPAHGLGLHEQPPQLVPDHRRRRDAGSPWALPVLAPGCDRRSRNVVRPAATPPRRRRDRFRGWRLRAATER